MRILGAVGANGSGKDEVLRYLAERYGVPYVSTGEIVRAIAALQGVEATRDRLGAISEEHFKRLGAGCFVKMAAERIAENGWPVAGIGGVRSADDVRLLKSLHADEFTLIHVVVSDPGIRFTRMKARGSARDPLDWETFCKLDVREETRFKTLEACSYADVVVRNDGDLEDLHREIDRYIDEGLLA